MNAAELLKLSQACLSVPSACHSLCCVRQEQAPCGSPPFQTDNANKQMNKSRGPAAGSLALEPPASRKSEAPLPCGIGVKQEPHSVSDHCSITWEVLALRCFQSAFQAPETWSWDPPWLAQVFANRSSVSAIQNRSSHGLRLLWHSVSYRALLANDMNYLSAPCLRHGARCRAGASTD